MNTKHTKKHVGSVQSNSNDSRCKILFDDMFQKKKKKIYHDIDATDEGIAVVISPTAGLFSNNQNSNRAPNGQVFVRGIYNFKKTTSFGIYVVADDADNIKTITCIIETIQIDCPICFFGNN